MRARQLKERGSLVKFMHRPLAAACALSSSLPAPVRSPRCLSGPVPSLPFRSGAVLSAMCDDHTLPRRNFLTGTAGAAAGALLLPRQVPPGSEYWRLSGTVCVTLEMVRKTRKKPHENA
jgi:hypothetical protein